MNPSFAEELNRALQKKGYQSLKQFYEDFSFSFTYEYLRQVLGGLKVPKHSKIDELAEALGLDAVKMKKIATETKLAHTIRRHYRQPQWAPPGKISEKVKRYRKDGQQDVRLLKMIEPLDTKQKDQVVDYIRFLKQQSRKKKKEGS